MNLSEETKAGTPHPASKGAFWAMINLILFFIIMMIVVLIVLTDDEIAKANTNVLYAIASKLFPEPWNYLAVLSTILSTIGTIETQILQFSRSMFAMARDDMLHPRYARIHPEWQTPWVATFVIWFLGVLLLFSSSYMPSVKKILESSILAIGFQICFYMSLAGFACAWHYRNKLKDGAYDAVSYVLWPLLAALFMVFIALYSIPTFDSITNIMGIGGILDRLCAFALGCGLRRAFAVGKYVHQIGYWDNADAYEGAIPSWHHRLRDSGHRVVSIGKLHFRGRPGDDNGFSEEIIPMNILEGKGDLLGLVRSDLPERGMSWKIAKLAGPGESPYTHYDREIAARAQIWLREEAPSTATSRGCSSCRSCRRISR